MRHLVVSLTLFILSTVALTAQSLSTQVEVDAWGAGRTEISITESTLLNYCFENIPACR